MEQPLANQVISSIKPSHRRGESCHYVCEGFEGLVTLGWVGWGACEQVYHHNQKY